MSSDNDDDYDPDASSEEEDITDNSVPEEDYDSEDDSRDVFYNGYEDLVEDEDSWSLKQDPFSDKRPNPLPKYPDDDGLSKLSDNLSLYERECEAFCDFLWPEFDIFWYDHRSQHF